MQCYINSNFLKFEIVNIIKIVLSRPILNIFIVITILKPNNFGFTKF